METNYEWMPATNEQIMSNSPYTPVEDGIEEAEE